MKKTKVFILENSAGEIVFVTICIEQATKLLKNSNLILTCKIIGD